MLADDEVERPVPDLRERRRQEMRAEISSVALKLFERHGFAATTVGDIAREAGISQSTYFRHFPTKEESVVGIDTDLERAIIDRVRRPEVDSFGLRDIEAVCETFTMRTCEDSESLERVLRVRRLMLFDSHLRSAAIALDEVVVDRIVDAMVAKLDGRESRSYARLITQTAMMTLRVAFDEWAGRIDSGDASVTVSETYRAACRDLRRVIGT